MADNELTLKLKLEDQQFKKGMQEVVSFGKLIETEYKRGKISATEAGNAINKLMVGIDGLGKVAKPSTDALASLWHMQNRIGLGFKSLATETVGARNQFKEMLSEQRLGNRLMSETVGSIRTLSNAFGMGGLGGTVGKMADSFQGVEFAVNGMGTAMSSAGGKVGNFGRMLLGVATPLTILGAGLSFAIGKWNELADAATAAGKATAQAFMTGAEKRLQAGDPATWMRTLESRRTEASRKATGLEGEYMRMQGIASSPFLGSAEGKLAAYQAQAAYKTWQEALKERIRLDDLIWDAQQKEKKNAEGKSQYVANVNTGVVAADPSSSLLMAGGQYGPSNYYAGEAPSGVGFMAGASGMAKYRAQVMAQNRPGGVAVPSPIHGVAGDSWGELDDKSRVFFGGMQSMVGTLSQEVRSGLGGAFVATFGEANSLMEKLLQSFMVGIGDALLTLGMRTAVSYIPIIGPLLASQINSTTGTGYGLVPGNEATLMSHSSGGGVAALSGEVAMLSQVIRSGRWDVDGSKLRYVLNKDLNNDRYRRQ